VGVSGALVEVFWRLKRERHAPVTIAMTLIATAMIGVVLGTILDRLEIIDLFGLLEAKLRPGAPQRKQAIRAPNKNMGAAGVVEDRARQDARAKAWWA
jgi:hypothetical protein